MNDQELKIFLQERIAKDLELEVNEVPTDADLSNFGLSSIIIAFIEGEIEEMLNMEIPPGTMYRVSSIEDAVKTLLKEKERQAA